MNMLPTNNKVQVLNALVGGNSIRATVRMTGVAKNTIVKLLVEIGKACEKYQDETLRNLSFKQVQCDEIWSLVGAKEKNAKPEKGWSDVWTWVARDPESKLVTSFMVGDRTARTAQYFMDDLASRLANRIQLTTDGHRVYLNAVENASGSNIDYAMLVKIYGNDAGSETRYGPAECIGCQSGGIMGHLKLSKISTTHVERQNLSMRMQMRRFTRSTSGLSKKAENHLWSVALHFMHYNFCRVHRTLRLTPAMQAGIADRVWTIWDIINLTETAVKQPKTERTDKKRSNF